MSMFDSYSQLFEADASKLEKGLEGAKKSAENLTNQLILAQSVSQSLNQSFTKIDQSFTDINQSVTNIDHSLTNIDQSVAVNIANSFDLSADAADRLGKMIGGSVVSGLKAAEEAAKKTEEKLSLNEKVGQKLAGSFIGLAKSVGSLFLKYIDLKVLHDIAVETAAHNEELDKQAKKLNLNVETMQEWQGAFESTGSSAEAFSSLFSKISEETDDPIGHINELADRFQHLSEQGKAELGKKLGLDAGAISLMSKGSQGIEELLKKQRELGIVSQEDIEVSKRFNEQQRQTKALFNDVKNQIGTALLPALTWLYEKVGSIVSYFREHKPFVISFFVALAAIITAALLPALSIAAGLVWGFVSTTLLIGGAFVAIAAAIALVVDDLYNFLKGNDSVIGELAKKWPIIGKVIEAIADAFKPIISSFSELWDAACAVIGALVDILSEPIDVIGGIQAVLADLIAYFPILGDVIDMIAGCFEWLGGIAKEVLGVIGEMISGIAKGVKWVAEKLGSKKKGDASSDEKKAGSEANPETLNVRGEKPAFSKRRKGIKNTDTGAGPALTEDVKKGREILAQTNTPLTSMTSSTIQNKNASVEKNCHVQVGKVDIHTQASDAQGISNGIGQALKNELSNAMNQFADGVAG